MSAKGMVVGSQGNDVSALEHSHDADAIARRLGSDPSPGYLQDWIYGGVDGAVTTFAIVAGAVGGALGERVILILGVANLVADGLSMAAANYTGVKAERDNHARLRQVEEKHLRLDPEGERREVEEIFRRQGFEGEALEKAVQVITADRSRWIETMMVAEYGVTPVQKSPGKAAMSTFLAFQVCGLVPLAPFLLGLADAWLLSVLCTCIVFFGIGSAKSRWSPQPAWLSGLEVLAIGAAAAGAAYGLGLLADALI
ncbi:MAG: VIT1/CCC1 transporter family protein [Neomegalonema sp.]|nr:VIT1/CCC1 transporter family protein [Neomegalonema sp.]